MLAWRASGSADGSEQRLERDRAGCSEVPLQLAKLNHRFLVRPSHCGLPIEAGPDNVAGEDDLGREQASRPVSARE